MSRTMMHPLPDCLLPHSHPVTWPLQSFTIGNDQKTTGLMNLYLDRANAEFGLIQYTASSIASVVRFPETDEPMYFQAKSARAAAWREKCKKVSILFAHLQLDLEFASADQASEFLDVLEGLAVSVGNLGFNCYEVPQRIAFVKADFDMEQQGFTNRTAQPLIAAVPNESSEWPHLRKTGEWSDFTVRAEGSKFAVHRVKLCKESYYFRAVCSGGFSETAKQSVELPESAQIVSTLLDEMYGVYNPTTGSLFTNFALRMEMEKERLISQLLDLFLAADKYNLEKIKRRASEAIIDRLPFITDPIVIVDLATCVYHEQCPENDRGLRRAIISQIRMRVSAILEDESAWDEYSKNKAVLRAFHKETCEVGEGGARGEAETRATAPLAAQKVIAGQ